MLVFAIGSLLTSVFILFLNSKLTSSTLLPDDVENTNTQLAYGTMNSVNGIIYYIGGCWFVRICEFSKWYRILSGVKTHMPPPSTTTPSEPPTTSFTYTIPTKYWSVWTKQPIFTTQGGCSDIHSNPQSSNVAWFLFFIKVILL